MQTWIIRVTSEIFIILKCPTTKRAGTLLTFFDFLLSSCINSITRYLPNENYPRKKEVPINANPIIIKTMLSDTHLVFKFWFPLALTLYYVRVCVHESVYACVCTRVSVCHRQKFDSIQKILSTGDTTWIEKMRASHAYIMMITSASKWLLCRTQSTVVCLETRSPICVIFRLINAMQSNKSERKYHFLRGCCFSPNRCHRNVCARQVDGFLLWNLNQMPYIVLGTLYLFIFFDRWSCYMRFNFVISLLLCTISRSTLSAANFKWTTRARRKKKVRENRMNISKQATEMEEK